MKKKLSPKIFMSDFSHSFYYLQIKLEGAGVGVGGEQHEGERDV